MDAGRQAGMARAGRWRVAVWWWRWQHPVAGGPLAVGGGQINDIRTARGQRQSMTVTARTHRCCLSKEGPIGFAWTPQSTSAPLHDAHVGCAGGTVSSVATGCQHHLRSLDRVAHIAGGASLDADHTAMVDQQPPGTHAFAQPLTPPTTNATCDMRHAT